MTDNKSDFLAKLASGGKNKYKRYTGMPLRYAGGKSLAVGQIIELFPENINGVVSPFIGGGSVEIACAKELGLRVQGYDTFSILCTYWDTLINQPKELADRISEWSADKPTYEKVKARLKEHWNGNLEITDSLELAAHYWFNHNLSYGPGFLGWMSSIYTDASKYGKLLDRIRTFDGTGMSVCNSNYEDSIPKHNGDFLYCDPPYYLEGDSKMFKGIYPQRNFPVHHNGFNHELLAELLRKHTGGFVLSYNDCSVVRELYKGFDIREVQWQYTMGQGETRIGKNRIANKADHVKKSSELLIVG